jgi:sulfotransferase 6B1
MNKTLSGKMEALIQPDRADQPLKSALIAPTFINTIPKAGTHLLEKVVRRLLGCPSSRLHIEQFTTLASPSDAAQDRTHKDVFYEVASSDLARMVGRIQPGEYATGHLLFSQSLATLLTEMRIKLVGILRDPRDIAVSFTKYVAQLEAHYLFDDYQHRSEADQLMTTIVGITDVCLSDAVPYLPRLMDIGQMVQCMLPWAYQPDTYTTSFERLIGPAGGGGRTDQIAEILAIAQYLGIDCAQSDVEVIADQLFGNTATFRKGQIGDWRNHFAPAHTRAFKAVAGQLLIDLGYERDLDW